MLLVSGFAVLCLIECVCVCYRFGDREICVSYRVCVLHVWGSADLCKM